MSETDLPKKSVEIKKDEGYPDIVLCEGKVSGIEMAQKIAVKDKDHCRGDASHG